MDPDALDRMRMLYLEMKRAEYDFHKVVGPHGFDISRLGLVAGWEAEWKKLKETLK